MTNEITSKPQYVFDNANTFETAQRMAKALSASSFVPKEYKGNMPNTLIALEVASRTGASILMVMQNLYIIHGRLSWSSQFIIAAINKCGRFTPLQFTVTKDEEDKTLTYNQKTVTFRDITCVAHTKDKDGNLYESPPISIEMARLEGWYDKNGSKWKTLPELMLRYRAASFFGKLYAPEILMGIQSSEESYDIAPTKDITPSNTEALTKRFNEVRNEPNPLRPPAALEEGQPEPIVEESLVKYFNEEGELVPLPERTKDDLRAKAEELIEQVKKGGDKVDLMQAFGGVEFLEKLKVAGLEQEVQNIREL